MSVADLRAWQPRFRISYGALLLILVAILLVMPPMVEAGYGLLVMSTLFPALFVIALFSVIEHRRVRLAALPLAVLVVAGDVLVLAFDFDLPLATRFIDIFFMILVAVACGVAAAVAATFIAPISGAFNALELFVGDFAGHG